MKILNAIFSAHCCVEITIDTGGYWLVDVDPSFALGAPEIILYKVTIDGSFSFLEKSQ